MEIHHAHRCGYNVALDTFGPTPMVLMVNVRPERQPNLLSREVITFDPSVPDRQFRDPFGNVATRILVPGGRIAMSADFAIDDHGQPDAYAPEARQIPVQELPDEALPFLLGSRYCDTDKLSQTAWNLFGSIPEGWSRAQAIVDYAHGRLRFHYMQADATRSAFDGHGQQVGVYRDFAHLAIVLCRCMNIPARYATGYLGDIGVPEDRPPMDFSA
jgi:transglutaminase-like putative cysteine protease